MPNQGVTLSTYEPSLRDRLAWMVGDLFGDDRTLRNWAQSTARGVADFIPGVGDAIGFDEAKRDWDAGNYGQAALGGALSAVGAVPGVGDLVAAGGKGALGMFIGPMAKGWNKQNFERALDMEYSGFSPDEIWRETGTMFDPNQGKRAMQEINDADSRIAPQSERLGFSVSPGSPDMLWDVFYHDELFDNYPQLADYGVLEEAVASRVFSRGQGGPSLGYGSYGITPQYVKDVSPGYPDHLIGVRTSNYPTYNKQVDEGIDPRSTMLHEIQHAIQRIEGWDEGFNPETAARVRQRYPESFPAQMAKNIERDYYAGPYAGANLSDTDKMNLATHAGKIADYETYFRNVGEAQARNVQTRRDMGLGERSIKGPWMTQDRDFDEQMIKYDILNGIYGTDVPGLSLRGPARRIR